MAALSTRCTSQKKVCTAPDRLRSEESASVGSRHPHCGERQQCHNPDASSRPCGGWAHCPAGDAPTCLNITQAASIKRRLPAVLCLNPSYAMSKANALLVCKLTHACCCCHCLHALQILQVVQLSQCPTQDCPSPA